MANYMLRNIPDDIYAAVQEAAADNNQSVNQFIITLIENRFERDEWVHAYSIKIDHIEHVECHHCGSEYSEADDVNYYRLYDQNDKFRYVVCEVCKIDV